MSEATVNNGRRTWLINTAVVGGAGTAAVAVPFVSSFQPSERAKAAGAAVEVDISKLAPGEKITVEWRGKPVFIRRRTEDEILEAEKADLSTLRDPQSDEDRIVDGNKEWLVVVGICTHLGCVPIGGAGDFNGWFCPCHGSHYDVSGRIRKGPAPTNMEIPKYEFVNANTIKIG